VTTDGKVTRVKDFNQLRLLLAQDENGLHEYVYSRLRLGDVWWIPDDVSGFGEGERHPWIIVRGYSARQVSVIACPRTTSMSSTRRGIVTPAGILPALDQDGLIVLKLRRSFVAKDFLNFEYIGRLPESWMQKILDFYQAMAEGKMTR
jgi:mRNA-degrading endonuclease toxin of MazEF toxin-antitoxin module